MLNECCCLKVWSATANFFSSPEIQRVLFGGFGGLPHVLLVQSKEISLGPPQTGRCKNAFVGKETKVLLNSVNRDSVYHCLVFGSLLEQKNTDALKTTPSRQYRRLHSGYYRRF